MIPIPLWVVNVLDKELPDLTGGDRDRVAIAIATAIPKGAIAAAVAFASQGVLCARNIRDGAGDLSREIGREASTTVLTMLLES